MLLWGITEERSCASRISRPPDSRIDTVVVVALGIPATCITFAILLVSRGGLVGQHSKGPWLHYSGLGNLSQQGYSDTPIYAANACTGYGISALALEACD